MSEIGKHIKIYFKVNLLMFFINRAFIYWRMLSSDPETTKKTVLCEKPDILEEGLKYEPDFLSIMLDTLG